MHKAPNGCVFISKIIVYLYLKYKMQNMMKYRFIFLFATAMALASCGSRTQYTIDGHLNLEGLDSVQIYLLDMATRQPVDSTILHDGSFQFKGEVERPYMAYIVANTPALGAQTLCVEPGNIYVDLINDSLAGTPINDQLYSFAKDCHESEYSTQLSAYLAVYRSATSSEERNAAEAAYDSIDALRIADMAEAAKAYYANNQDNILGAYVLTLWASESHPTAKELAALLEPASDDVKNFAPLQAAYSQLQAIENTAAGKHYTDIEGINYSTGEAGKLSQLIEGRVALVDFWASWCRPCRQEISENLIRIYKRYGKKGLQVVGVDVWDKPEQHKQAVEQMGITYPQLIDTTRNATTTYGISGIPQILLIGADGTIIARNLRGEAIEEAVIEALKK